MSDVTPHNLSPTELIDSLDAEAIAARLDELGREARALRVLLRSARARRQQARLAVDAPEEGPNAA